MKTIELGEYKYRICETADDLPIKRYVQLKEYLSYKDTGVDRASLIEMVQKFVISFDTESKSGMLIALKDYLTGLNLIRDKKDPDQLIFSVITFEEGEPNEFNEGFAMEKLNRMNEYGVTQGFIEDQIVNFIVASKTHFVTYFRKNLEAITQK